MILVKRTPALHLILIRPAEIILLDCPAQILLAVATSDFGDVHGGSAIVERCKATSPTTISMLVDHELLRIGFGSDTSGEVN